MYVEIGVLIGASLVITILSSLFALVESAIMVMDDIKFHLFINRSDVKDSIKNRVQKIMDKKDKHVTAMVVAITFTSILGSSLLGALAAKYLPQEQVIIFTISLTYLMLVFARTLPKIIASYDYEKILIKWSWIARGSYFVNYPFILMTMIWIKIFNLKSKRQMSLNELKMIIKHYRKNGIINKSEQKMLEQIFLIKQAKISDVVEKIETLTFDYNEEIDNYKYAFEDDKNKRFFVKDDDKYVGIIFFRDVASEIVKGTTSGMKVSSFVRGAILLSEDDNIMDTIVELKENNTTLGIVMDEETNMPLGTITLKQIYNHILTD